jgi:amino acid transporter
MTQTAIKPDQLDRGMGLPGAIATNILNMVGVGPFLTIPLALAAMGGPQAMIGWVLGALLALCDGLVWAELGSRFPRSGGPYHYLLEAYDPRKYGRLIAFLFLWQSLLIGPLSIASGAVGFAEYAGALHPASPTQSKLIAMVLCVLNMALLYRSIRSVAALSIAVMVAVLATCGWIVISGMQHFNASMAFSFPSAAFHLTRGFWSGLGAATLIAIYDYGGYNNVCLLGGEVRKPRVNIPRAVILSIIVVAALYLAMNLSILGTLPWQTAQNSKAIVADFMGVVHGGWAARTVSALILIASWGSAYAILLGYSRVPFAAAQDGAFPKAFARIHPEKQFPTISLLYMGLASAVLCLVSLAELISVLIVIQTLLQFVGQCVAVILLRRKHRERAPDVFRMPLYPLPVIAALIGWAYIVATSQIRHIAVALSFGFLGVIVFLLRARNQQEWPFAQI